MAMLRISEGARSLIKKIARKEGRKMNEIVNDAIHIYEQNKFFDDFDDAFTKMKANSGELEDYHKDLEGWDSALTDGLEEEAWNE